MTIPADGSAFMAEGTVEEKYERMTRMYVGVLQLTRNGERLDISGAAYGMGAPEWKQSLDPANPGNSEGWENATSADGAQIRVRRWAMELRGDYEHPLRPGAAVGFVLGEMPGGRVTGWIEDGLTLASAGPSTARLAIDDRAREVAYDAVLSADQRATADDVRRQLERAAAEVAAAKAKADELEQKLKDWATAANGGAFEVESAVGIEKGHDK
jgi:hypothetical protein